MEYTQESLHAIQNIELDILKEVIRVCEENQIEYFAHAGTTLGAMRHQGFIPWDDDIDIAMMRGDYNRFLSIAPQKLKSGYILQHFLVEPNTPTYFAKVRKEGTLFVEGYCENIPMNKGIYIDIMPFDYMPDANQSLERYRRKVVLANNLFIAKTTPCVTFEKNKIKKSIKQLVRSVLHTAMIPVSKEILYKNLDNSIREFEHSPTKTIGTRALPECVYKYSDVFPLKNGKFEDISIKVPNNPDVILTATYGDWRKLPPKEKQYTHAPIKFEY